MTELISIAIAVVIHVIFRFTIFINCQNHNLMSLMGLSSFLVLASISMYLRNFQFITERYKKKSKFFAIISEIVFCSFAMEVSTLVIWSNFETLIELTLKTIFKANKLNLYEEIGGDSILGFIIMSIAFYFLIYSIIVTQNTMSLANFFVEMLGKLQARPINKCPREIPPADGPLNIRRNVRLTKPAAH